MTRIISFRGIAFLAIVSTVLLYVATRPIDRDLPIERSMIQQDYVKLIYRGVNMFHPGYIDAKAGTAKPIGGHELPGLHRDGYTDSEFTSWTTDITIAYTFATTCVNGRCSGVILIKRADLTKGRYTDMKTIPGGDKFHESEILVKGIMEGAIPVFVRPGLDKDGLLDLIKSKL